MTFLVLTIFIPLSLSVSLFNQLHLQSIFHSGTSLCGSICGLHTMPFVLYTPPPLPHDAMFGSTGFATVFSFTSSFFVLFYTAFITIYLFSICFLGIRLPSELTD